MLPTPQDWIIYFLAVPSRYVLQCDIQKYFPSIDHEILKGLLRRKIKCPDTLWLIDTIIDNRVLRRALFCARVGGCECVERAKEESKPVPVMLVTISKNQTGLGSLVGV